MQYQSSSKLSKTDSILLESKKLLKSNEKQLN